MKLGEVATEIRDRINSSQISIEQYVTTENMVKDRGGVVVADSMPNDAGLVRYRIGDVLIANIRPYLKKIWLSNCEGGCSSDVVVYRASTSELSSEYLHSALSSDDFFDYVMRKTRGTKMPRGDRDWMLQFELPLPPLAVQHEIVARLEKDLAAVERMAKGFAALKAEADQLFKSTLKETFEEVSRGGEMHRRSFASEGRFGEAGPEGRASVCETRRLGDVCEIVVGKTPLRTNPRFWNNGVVAWFTIDDLRDQGREIFSTRQKITSLAAQSMRMIPANTVLLCCTASVGACAITRIPLTTNQQFNALIPVEKELLMENFLYYFCTGLTPILLELSSRTTIDFVSKTKVEGIEIPIPPLSTQRKIVAKLDAVRERCEKLKRAAEEGLQTAALMRKAILKEAFA